MRIAVCPGSFDPVTKGHINVIQRAAKQFDRIIVVVLTNPNKTPMFSVEQRMDFLRRSTAHIENVEVDYYGGLLAEYVREKGACAIIKGLRAVSDFEYEFQQALTNKKINPNMETLFLITSSEYMYLSSSIVKQVAQFGGDISDFVPEAILPDIRARFSKGE